MSNKPDDEALDGDILASWHINASPWVRAVRDGEIASREQLTNQAIIDTLCALKPKSLLDIGCGEGWLCRAMQARGCDCLGIDAVPDLVSAAMAEAGGRFLQMRYEDLPHWQPPQRADCAVCNFSLIGRQATEAVFAAIHRLVAANGYLVVQTLHPQASTTQRSGWQAGSWAGFADDFSQPAPWYFRTLNDWRALFQRHDIQLIQERSPSLPGAGHPASLILVGQLNSQ